MYNNEGLCILVGKNINDIRSKQRENIRLHCMYLKKSYTCAVQFMNKLKWSQCCCLAINKIIDVGLDKIKSHTTIGMLNR